MCDADGLCEQLGWLIVLVAAIITQVRDQGGFPKFGWWAVAYSFVCIVGTIVVVASASQDIYAVAVSI